MKENYSLMVLPLMLPLLFFQVSNIVAGWVYPSPLFSSNRHSAKWFLTLREGKSRDWGNKTNGTWMSLSIHHFLFRFPVEIISEANLVWSGRFCGARIRLVKLVNLGILKQLLFVPINLIFISVNFEDKRKTLKMNAETISWRILYDLWRSRNFVLWLVEDTPWV